mmetsp:Transcript_80792/g.160533  ORF Transcript_80792/g.160533 Transcript_80792/m.160533 type:complete len:143 (-) Transcript_80792:165-593(-)
MDNSTSMDAPRTDVASGCGVGEATFVSLLSGSRYIAAALCLHTQLVRVSSRCRLTLVYDDREVNRTTGSPLEETLGARNLIPLTRLMRKLPNENSPYGAQWAALQNRSLRGRRLYQGSTERSVNFLKFWLWALPFTQAVHPT